MTTKWPRDNQEELIRFYGMPGPAVEAQLVDVIPPFKMYYAGKQVHAIKFHKKAAAALTAALQEIWDYYKHDQAMLDKLKISNEDGTYNPRKVRGSATKWSNHAFGAAIDLDASDNGLNQKGDMPPAVIRAFKRQGARWGGDYKGRKDPMHFEFCDNGEALVIVSDAAIAKPPTMATSKIGNATIVEAATVTTSTGVGIASQLMSAGDSVQTVATMVDQSGQVIDKSVSIAKQVPHGFWENVITTMHSPIFIGCLGLMSLTICGLIWYWRRQHMQAGV